MSQIDYSLEATYIFRYNGDATYEYHFIDNLIGYRHRSLKDTVEGEIPMPLNVKGTNQPHQVFEATLVGERVYYEDENGQLFADLLYLLPDIEYYVKVEYKREYELGQWNVNWGISSSILLIKAE
jgi:hypothetical protein